MLSHLSLGSLPDGIPSEELCSRREIWIFSREARNARESIRTAYAYAAYHVVIIDAGRCRQERVRVLPRRITDADERSLITLAVRILSLALNAPCGSLDRLYARTSPATNNSPLQPIRRRIARIIWNYNSCARSNNNRDRSTRRRGRCIGVWCFFPISKEKNWWKECMNESFNM